MKSLFFAITAVLSFVLVGCATMPVNDSYIETPGALIEVHNDSTTATDALGAVTKSEQHSDEQISPAKAEYNLKMADRQRPVVVQSSNGYGYNDGCSAIARNNGNCGNGNGGGGVNMTYGNPYQLSTGTTVSTGGGKSSGQNVSFNTGNGH